MRRTLHVRLSALSGFWNTICIARMASTSRALALPGNGWSSRLISLPSSGSWMPSNVLASVVLPDPDSPTRPSVSPSASSRSTATRAGMS